MEITNGKVHDESAEFAHKNPRKQKNPPPCAFTGQKGARQWSLLEIKHLFTPFHIFMAVLVYK
jgi:hypothetical protein